MFFFICNCALAQSRMYAQPTVYELLTVVYAGRVVGRVYVVLRVNEDNAMRMSVLQWVYIVQRSYKLEAPPPMNECVRSL